MDVLDELESLIFPAESEIPRSVSGVEAIDLEPLAPVFVSGLGRDADVISNMSGPDVVSSTDVLPRGQFLTDNRRFNFDNGFDVGELSRGAGRVVAADFPDVRPPDWKWEEKFRRKLPVPPAGPRSYGGSQLAFSKPSRLAICLKRKIRREIAFALGFGGVFHLPRHFTRFSRIRC